ncbi:hypothetical protein [Cohnella zeiphila]|uniref:Uncharacterized protein n=1 Tax=Cohnella zeiphila TaxID=2761120 RepID=A0A7X0VXG5_9BACL|nr:hypothetical protein [Cohnella zeiphila]MBB6731903.1 hypothetical protein [Cohnella zeiphila]
MRDILLRMNNELYETSKRKKSEGLFQQAFEAGRLDAYAEVYGILKKYTTEILREYDSLDAKVKVMRSEPNDQSK